MKPPLRTSVAALASVRTRHTRVLVISAALLTLLTGTGCVGPQGYAGDGKITNTSHWDSPLERVPEYTITLASFQMGADFAHEFALGQVERFRGAAAHVYVRFTDDCHWWHFKDLAPEERDERSIEKWRMRNIDTVQGRIAIRLVADTGAEVLRTDAPLSEC